MKIPFFPDEDTYTGEDGREHSMPEEEFEGGALTAIPTVDESHQAGATTPDRAGYKTITFAGTAADQPQLLLPYDANRYEAFIVVQVAAMTLTATAAFAAGAGATSATLPAGAPIIGFDVSGEIPTGTSTLQVTVTGAAGGTLTYWLTGDDNGQENLGIRFPSPLPPAAAAIPIAVTVTGGANTPAGSIVAYGSTGGGAVYIGKQNQVDNASAKPGCALPTGTYPYRAKEAVYVISDQAHPSTVSFFGAGWNN